jgi:hypothetical protein
MVRAARTGTLRGAEVVSMPESVGKRMRRDAKAKKAVAREERRLARNQRREDRAAGIIEPGTPIEASEDLSYLDVVPLEETESEA